jgi:16S rRNA processing protein RimM
MNIETCFQFGKVLKPHGLKGALLVTVVTEQAAHLKDVKNIFIEINARLVPFFIDTMTFSSKTKAILQIEDLNTEEEAAALAGHTVYLPLSILPPLGQDQFYYHEVIGYTVIDELLGTLGVVQEIYEMPGQDLIAMQYHAQEVLIPIASPIVQRADHQLRTITVRLPEGLLELYAENNNNNDPHEN